MLHSWFNGRSKNLARKRMIVIQCTYIIQQHITPNQTSWSLPYESQLRAGAFPLEVEAFKSNGGGRGLDVVRVLGPVGRGRFGEVGESKDVRPGAMF